MNRKTFALVAIVFALLLPLTMAGGITEDAPKAPNKGNPELHNKAKKLYGFDCAMCHGENGSGNTDMGKDMKLRDWTDPKSLADKSDADLFKVIRKGSAKMPAEDSGRAKDDEIWYLVYRVRSFAKTDGGSAPAATPAPAAPTN